MLALPPQKTDILEINPGMQLRSILRTTHHFTRTSTMIRGILTVSITVMMSSMNQRVLWGDTQKKC